MGEIAPEVREALELRDTVLVAEVRLDPLVAALDTAPKHRPIPAFPGMDRDINLVLDESVPWDDLDGVVRQARGRCSTRCGSTANTGVPDSAREESYVFRLVYRSSDRTLTSDEVDEAQKRVVAACAEKLGAVQR